MKKSFFILRTVDNGICINNILGSNYTKINLRHLSKDSKILEILNNYIDEHKHFSIPEVMTSLNLFSDYVIIPEGELANPENWFTFCHNSEKETAYIVTSAGDTYERISTIELSQEDLLKIILD